MVWNPNFPTNNTLINQSVNQIQTNWTFIQNNINTDHFFNSGAPQEGHHRFVNMPDNGGDAAVALAGVIYLKTQGASVLPFYRNVGGVGQIPIVSNTTVVLGVGPAQTVFPAGGSQSFMGNIYISDNSGATTARASARVLWNLTTNLLIIDQVFTANNITALVTAGTNIQVTTTAGFTARVIVTTNYF